MDKWCILNSLYSGFAFCRGTANRHGYFLAQALRYTVEEINNSTRLLPGVSLGFQTYDTCSVPASILATVDLLAQQHNKVNLDPRAVALIGPDSSSYAFTPAAALGSYLLPMVIYLCSVSVTIITTLVIVF